MLDESRMIEVETLDHGMIGYYYKNTTVTFWTVDMLVEDLERSHVNVVPEVVRTNEKGQPYVKVLQVTTGKRMSERDLADVLEYFGFDLQRPIEEDSHRRALKQTTYEYTQPALAQDD